MSKEHRKTDTSEELSIFVHFETGVRVMHWGCFSGFQTVQWLKDTLKSKQRQTSVCGRKMCSSQQFSFFFC